MSDFVLRYPASAIAGKHRLTADDILLLRKHMFPKGLTSPDDAEQLVALHRSPTEKCPEWDNWFVEMMAAYIVVHCYPQHSLDDINAEWLIAMVSADGGIATPAELELVLHAIELARAVPDRLSAFALDQLRIAIQHGTGIYAAERDARRQGITAGDMAFLYRILRGSLFEGKMLVSRREVAVLDRIGSLTQHGANHPAWHDLTRSIARRTPEGHAPASPWLRMLVDDIALDEAA